MANALLVQIQSAAPIFVHVYVNIREIMNMLKWGNGRPSGLKTHRGKLRESSSLSLSTNPGDTPRSRAGRQSGEEIGPTLLVEGDRKVARTSSVATENSPSR